MSEGERELMSCRVLIDTCAAPKWAMGDVLKVCGHQWARGSRWKPRDGELGSGSDDEASPQQLPTREEVEAHNLTHMPYRFWCKHCVRTKARLVGHYPSTTGDIAKAYIESMTTCYPVVQ
eukprot:3943773-Amphidinium_carterae.2